MNVRHSPDRHRPDRRRPDRRMVLRDVTVADLPTLFAHQRDPVANRMAAFAAKDPDDREVVGHIGRFDLHGAAQVTYRIDPRSWGAGMATQALTMFFDEVR